MSHHQQVSLISSLKDLLIVIEQYLIFKNNNCRLDKHSVIPIVNDHSTMRIMGAVQIENCLNYFKTQISKFEQPLPNDKIKTKEIIE